MNEIAIAPPKQSDRFAVIVAQWNRGVTARLLDGALAAFAAGNVSLDNVDVAWVPGSWELPLPAKRCAASGKYAAVICLGAVIRGETTHDQHINRAVSMAISEISLETDIPVLFGLLTCESMDQALARAGGAVGNKGAECVDAALHMVGLLRNLPGA